MHPIDFILRVLGSRLPLEQSEYERAQATLTADFDAADNVVTRTLKSPYVIIILPILIPIFQAGLDRILNWINPPKEETPEESFMDGLQALIDQHRGGGS